MMSLTPDHHHRKVGTMAVAPSPAPFLTPRPERRRPDSRGSEWTSYRHERDREVNVQVLLRCRPLNDDEQKLNVPRVITCNEHKREVTVLQSVANKQVDRVFTFDKVFGPKAQQRSIYDQAISPIVNEVLEGFNCTVFAYGQTGTGKTYTMEGGMKNKGGDLPAEAGVIPRAVRQIFDTLEAQNADYSMKVTFLELYNEEITDLLVPDDPSKSLEEKQKKPVSLMEDGKGCVVIRGLEEEAVYSANEIYNLLERGAARRRTADTLLNKRSSRSHSVFSITVHIKEAGVGEEELIKCGKLNLVDLAGSENISRSGAREARAREAGEINKSLLTLGRVINALVEHSAHIPYRDSKLTRLLRDSLGGKTKTCIIATVSPSAHCLEETLSTLDYAHRAKNIKNKPEANQKMSKTVLLKDLYMEIERMKQDVRAAREKNGVYIPHERFMQDEAEKKAKNEKIEQLENDLNTSEKQVDQFRELYLSEQEEKLTLMSELRDCKANLDKSNKALQDLQENYSVAVAVLKEKELIISKLLHSENILIERAKELSVNLQDASDDISALFSKLDYKDKMEADNHALLLRFGSHLDQSLKDLHKTILGSVCQQQQQIRSMEEHVSSFLASKTDVTQIMESKITKLTETYHSGMGELKELGDLLHMKAATDLEDINSRITCQATAVQNFLKTASLEAKNILSDIGRSLDEQRQLIAFSAEKQEEGLKQSFASAQVITRETNNFFNDLHKRASELMKVLEESQMVKSQKLQKYESMLKEEAHKEEKLAMEKIAAILATVTRKRNTMVLEAFRSIQDSNVQDNKRFLQELSNMQQVSVGAKKELCGFEEDVKYHFLEGVFTSAETRTTMEDYLHECSKKVNNSRQHWESAQTGINNIVKDNLADIESVTQEKSGANKAMHDKFLSNSSSMEFNFEARVQDLLVSVKDSLMLDRENKKEIDTMSAIHLDQLNTIRSDHGKYVSDIRDRTEQCVRREYLVDQHVSRTPARRVITIPNLDTIEGMRTPITDTSLESKGKWINDQGKIQQQPGTGVTANRTPFAEVN